MIKETNISQEHIKNEREALGSEIKLRRECKLLTIEEVAEAIGVAPATIKKIEAGEFPTKIDLYIKIGVFLDYQLTII